MIMTFSIECKNGAVVDEIYERYLKYANFEKYRSISAERISFGEIHLRCVTNSEPIVLCKAKNLEFSRFFYKTFSPFFKYDFKNEECRIDFVVDEVFTSYPIDILKEILKNRDIGFSIKNEIAGFGLEVYREMSINIVKTRGLRNSVIFIYYLFLFLSSLDSPHEIRHEVVKQEINMTGARNLLDLGCGNGNFLISAFKECDLLTACGIEASRYKAKEAKRRIRFRKLNRRGVDIINGRIEKINKGFSQYDIITLIEVIEHMTIGKLGILENALFGIVRPDNIIITTPNRDFNKYLKIRRQFRHADHFFEWSYLEFREWATKIGTRYNYKVEIMPVGGMLTKDDCSVSQLALFSAF